MGSAWMVAQDSGLLSSHRRSSSRDNTKNQEKKLLFRATDVKIKETSFKHQKVVAIVGKESLGGDEGLFVFLAVESLDSR